MDPYSYSFESVDLASPSCGAGQEKKSWHETCTTNHKSVELTINFKKALYSENKSLKFISVYYTVSTISVPFFDLLSHSDICKSNKPNK